MHRDQFIEGFPGRLVDTAHGVPAFAPAPLFPKIDFNDGKLLSALVEAKSAIARASVALPREYDDPWLVLYPLLYREAYFSSRMEGTHTTPSELILFDARPHTESPRARETREVMNYVSASVRALRFIKDENHPVSQRVIKMAHQRLLSGVRGGETKPGEYRTTQAFIGRGADIKNARYVAPPPEMIEELMQDLERKTNTRESFPPLLVRIAMIHYQFEAIHPFSDGNGRIGRLLVPLIMCEQKELDSPLVHISPVIDKREQEYRDLLLRVSTHGDWRSWVVFFLEVLRDSADAALAKANELFQLRRKYLELASTKRTSILVDKLISEIMAKGRVTFKKAASVMGVSPPQAAQHVRKLEKLGILEEVTGGTRNLIFRAPEVLECVFAQ